MIRHLSIPAMMTGVMVLGACVAPTAKVSHPAQAAGVAVGYVAVSPLLILKGLSQGIAAAPHFANGDAKAMNAALEKAGAPVTIARTYRYAYGSDLSAQTPGPGKVFRSMGPATLHFQNVLRGYDIQDAQNYFLTAERSADNQGYTLYAVIYRPTPTIRVREDGLVRTLTPADDAFYLPYSRDAAGRPLDLVLEWAAVPRTAIRTQQGQAVLMTIAANSVAINRRRDDYWDIERRWRSGQFREITERQQKAVASEVR